MNSWVKWLLVSVLALSVGAFYTITKIKSVSSAYLFAYPLVVMEQSRDVFLNSDSGDYKSNQFIHVQNFPDHKFRNVVRPNNDTLYSIAWIDLSNEPLILSVPDTEGRYYVMPFMDAWTNVFAMVGRRTTGSGAGDFALVGPNSKTPHSLPHGVKQIRAPTNMVFLIGRIQTNGESDIASVINLQTKFQLTTLSEWGEASSSSSTVAHANNSDAEPMSMVDSLDANDFFQSFSSLLIQQEPAVYDINALENLESLGVSKGKLFGGFGPIDNIISNFAIDITQRKLAERINSSSNLENGWSVHRSIIGNYLDNYALRAAVTKIGLGALPPEEAVYPNTVIDSNGEPLNGANRYNIHFEEGEAPPVNAFWSLSMYDADGFFIDNSLKRYSMGDRNSLQYNADGSLDISIQFDEPLTGKTNWLPSPSGNFALTMRLYSPKDSFLKGDWKMPTVQVIDQ